MNWRILLFFVLLVNGISPLKAQKISSFQYLDMVTIPYDTIFDGQVVGGLSAITLHPNGSYYFAADKPPSRVFKARIEYTGQLTLNLNSVILLNPNLLQNSELEGICYNNSSKTFYVADEQAAGTRIIEIDDHGRFIRIIEPKNKPYLMLSDHNSGIEGLTLSNDTKYLFYSFERPTIACFDKQLVKIIQMDLRSQKTPNTFYYQLHPIKEDKINSNGISEILYLNDNSLLVMERAYIPGKGNIVRLYRADLPYVKYNNDLPCIADDLIALRSTLLFDFGDVKEIKIDNAEGMTFNTDRNLLFIVTDNNFSKKQKTQVIVLGVNWH